MLADLVVQPKSLFIMQQNELKLNSLINLAIFIRLDFQQ